MSWIRNGCSASSLIFARLSRQSCYKQILMKSTQSNVNLNLNGILIRPLDMAWNNSSLVSPCKGRYPQTISNTVIPSDQISTDNPYFYFIKISGAICVRVPKNPDVIWSSSSFNANPKSISLNTAFFSF